MLLFDAGEGTQRNLTHTNLGLNRKTKVFITHLHGDHCVGLLGLLQTMSMVQRDKPLHVFGPEGTKDFIKFNMEILGFSLTFPLHVNTVEPGKIVEERDYVVTAAKANHNVPTLAYLLEEKPRPGRFHPERAVKAGVPEGELWSRLQHGETISLGGRRIRPSQVLGPPRAGRKLGISGDTRPSRTLERFFTGADVLVFDSTYGDTHADKALENYHSTAREAATLANKAKVKLLVLTHFSARYEDVATLVAEASEVHPRVVAAEDLWELEVPYPS